MADAKTLPWQMDTATQERADPDSTLKDYWKNLEYELIPLSKAHPYGLEGRFNKPPPRYERALRVCPIPATIDIATLEAIFNPYGDLMDTRILADEGYAAVVFAVKGTARRAQQALNGQLLFAGAGIAQVEFARIYREQRERTLSIPRPDWTDPVPHNPLLRYLTGRAVRSDGTIQDENGTIVGRIREGSVTGHFSCTVQYIHDCDFPFMATEHRGDVVNTAGELVARASLMPWKEKQLRQQGYGVWKSFRPQYDKLISRKLNENGHVLDSHGQRLGHVNGFLPDDHRERMTVATDGDVLDAEGNLMQTVFLEEYSDTDPSDEEGDIDAAISKTIKKEDEGQDEKTPKEKEEGERQQEEAPKPAFYTHYTISRDLSGSNDEVATKLLSALAERERSRDNRFAKADLTLLSGRR